MNKKEYIESLLSLCTDRQKEIFFRMYPTGVGKHQVDIAKRQLETTFKRAEADKEKYKYLSKEFSEEKRLNEIVKQDFNNKIDKLEKELSLANSRILNLNSKENIENAETIERLELLSALEAGGVDNWDFYDDAIENYNNK